MKSIWKRAAWPCLLAQAFCLAAPCALAQGSSTLAWPSQTSVQQVLAQSPAYLAALRRVEAEQSVQQQYQMGSQEWTASFSAAHREQKSPTSERTNEWELGLERGVRLPGKARAYEQAGQARVALAQAQLQQVWREQARTLLGRYGAWLREQETVQVWTQQVNVLAQQLKAVSRRHGLGDAARIEQQQAQAALAQAQAQAQASSGRALAAKQALQWQFPGLALLPLEHSPDLFNFGYTVDACVQAQLDRSPELAVAQLEARTAQTQMHIETVESRPDPTVGVRLGRARSGAETVVGMVFSVPIGGGYRAAGALAAASRAAASVHAQADTARRIEAEAALRLQEAQSTQAVLATQQAAAHDLTQVAEALARGYQLGEGNLSDVLNARRQAHEQQLAASSAQVDAQISRYRLALEAGRVWAAPEQ
jgi:cobalt-zinc-cadmium efflux system outer membrane protein